MVKKVLTLTLGLLLFVGAMAQSPKTAAISPSDVRYWVGSGSNQAVVLITWEELDNSGDEYYVGAVWGVRFNGSILCNSLMDTLSTYDVNLTVSMNPGRSFINDITYSNSQTGLVLNGSGMGWWMYNVNGVMASAISAQTISNGDFVEWSDMGQFAADTIIFLEDPNAPAQPVEATIDFDDILYWVGTGSNEAVLAVNWADTALAWGYRWTGSATVEDMMAAIASDDPRFSYSGSGWLDDIMFNDGTVNLAGTPGNYWGSTNNGIMDAGMSQPLSDGDFEKWGDPAAGVIVDSMEYYGTWYYTYAYPMTVYPVSVPGTTPVVEDATIAASDILFWVGHGENEAILAVNWADTALAWGYRFAADSVSSATMLADIAAADPRLTIEGTGFVSDIRYIDTAAGMTDTLAVTPGNWWGSLLNGYSDMGTGQMLHDGDLQKWGDPAAGVIADSMEYGGYWYYTYVYPMTIHAVTVPDTTGTVEPVDPEHGPFCGAVGAEGCNAIKADSSAIVAWATGVTVTRGPRNIANPDLGLAATGTESNAIGMATLNDVYDVVSLGDGGSALVTFARPIRNGEGPDFAVYENGFSDNSLELAFVEVSTDGQRFVRFPATCLTQTETQLANAGQTDPTNLNNLAGKFRIGYGTPFDLEELRDSTGINIDSIVYVRVVDVVGSIDPQYGTYDAYGHIINDPWPTPFEASGYDLTGVAVLHENTNTSGITEVMTVEGIWPNPTADRVNVSMRYAAEGLLYDLTGRQVAAYSLREGLNTLDLTNLKNGVYMLRTEGSVSKIVKK